MNKINYHVKMKELIQQIEKRRQLEELSGATPASAPSLLLHCCCAPCSSYCLELLTPYFEITAYYYNPNISDRQEYDHRAKELKRFVEQFPNVNPIHCVIAPYDGDSFVKMTTGMEEIPEGGSRCFLCYEQRLRHTALKAKEEGYDYFATTLSISPLKNAAWLNEIGEGLQEELNTKYLYSDFKKNNGYKRSTELSKEYDLYRQDYCGCEFSKKRLLDNKENA